MNLGVLLDIKYDKLEQIRSCYSDDKVCLREMLNIWLQQSPEPSWSAMAEAIEVVGHQALADQLRTKSSVSMKPPRIPVSTPPAVATGTAEPVENRLTDKQHHGVLVEQLSQWHAAKWREIGGKLRFTEGELDNIQANGHLLTGSPGSWFSAMLSQWLQWAPGDARGSTNFATLEALKDALRQAKLGVAAHELHL